MERYRTGKYQQSSVPTWRGNRMGIRTMVRPQWLGLVMGLTGMRHWHEPQLHRRELDRCKQ
jgi:hypothetical protein